MRVQLLSCACLLLGVSACIAAGDPNDDPNPQNNTDAGMRTTADSGTRPEPGSDAGPDAGSPAGDASTGGSGGTIVNGGDVSGTWQGTITLRGQATVPTGATLRIAAGTVVTAESGSSVTVRGTLTLDGSASSKIRFDSASWSGIVVASGGRIEGGQAEINNGSVCLDGQAGSSIALDGMTFAGCSGGLRFGNGGTIRHTRILAGSTVSITGGLLEMSDSTIEFRNASDADCTHFGGGTAHLDHVRFTKCHCPLHIARTDAPLLVTNSVFDVASYSVMISSSQATFTGNHFESSQAEFLDIGGGIAANIGGNYWGGGAPNISSTTLSQFTGANDYRTTPIAGVGPR